MQLGPSNAHTASVLWPLQPLVQGSPPSSPAAHSADCTADKQAGPAPAKASGGEQAQRVEHGQPLSKVDDQGHTGRGGGCVAPHRVDEGLAGIKGEGEQGGT